MWRIVKVAAAGGTLAPLVPTSELGIRFATPGGQTYMMPIYIDHYYFRGRTIGVRDAIGAHTVFQEWSFDPANRDTTVGLRDAAGTMQPTTFRYTDVGQDDQVTDPYSNVTPWVFDNDWRVTSVDHPGSVSGSGSCLSRRPQSPTVTASLISATRAR